MKQTELSRTPSPHSPTERISQSSSVQFPVPHKFPPPIPPKIPNGFHRKISMPALPSTFTHPSAHNPPSDRPHPPPVPRLPQSYHRDFSPDRFSHPSDHSSQPPVRHVSHNQESSRLRAGSIPEHARSQLPSSSSFGSSSSSPLSFFRRPLPNPRVNATHPSPPTSGTPLVPSHSSVSSPHHSSTASNNRTSNHHHSESLPAPPLTPTTRPLPHLPHTHLSNPALNASTSSYTNVSPSTSTDRASSNTSLHSSPPSHHQSKRAPMVGPGVSYTNMLHDHDSPLGAHSIPTRISTRPITFTSPDRQESPHLTEDSYMSMPLPQTSYEPHDLKPINTADRDMFLSGLSLFSQEPSGSQPQSSQLQSSLQIYTTRPSNESTRPGRSSSSGSRHRSNSVSEAKPGSAAARHEFVSLGLSVDRPNGLLSHSTSTRSHKGVLGKGRSGLRNEPAGSRTSHLVMVPNFNIALVSHVAKFLKDNVPRGTKIKGSIEYPLSFTGREAVVRAFSSLPDGFLLIRMADSDLYFLNRVYPPSNSPPSPIALIVSTLPPNQLPRPL